MNTTLKKILVWLKTYWYIPLLLIVMFFLVVSSGNFSEIGKYLQRRRRDYQKEKDEIDRIQEEKEKRLREIEVQYQETLRKIEEERQRRGEAIARAEKARIKKIIEKSQEDPTEGARLLEKEFGIRRVQ